MGIPTLAALNPLGVMQVGITKRPLTDMESRGAGLVRRFELVNPHATSDRKEGEKKYATSLFPFKPPSHGLTSHASKSMVSAFYHGPPTIKNLSVCASLT